MLVFNKIKNTYSVSIFAAAFLFSSFGVASHDDYEREEGGIRLYPAGIHEINSLTGPYLEFLPPVREINIPEEKRDVYNTVMNFVHYFIWQKREETLYWMPNEEDELYKGVKINHLFKTKNNQDIVVVENEAHPSFVTHAGENPLDYWVEFYRQKNLCFVNDLWAELSPAEGIKPSRDFCIALKRLSQDLLQTDFLGASFSRKPENLKVLLERLNRNYEEGVDDYRVYRELLKWSMHRCLFLPIR